MEKRAIAVRITISRLSIFVWRNGRTVITFTITRGPQMSNNQQLGAIGLDIGGTKIAAGVVLVAFGRNSSPDDYSHQAHPGWRGGPKRHA